MEESLTQELPFEESNTHYYDDNKTNGSDRT